MPPIRPLLAASLALTLPLAACNPTVTADLRGDVRADVNANVNGRLAVDTPVPIAVQNPLVPIGVQGQVPIAAAAPLPVVPGGPITVNVVGPSVRYEGVQISDDLLDRVKTDRTTDDWVLAVFGEPTGRGTLRDGTEIWKWVYRPVQQQTAIVEVFGGGDRKEPKLATQSVFLRLRDGVVIEKWKG